MSKKDDEDKPANKDAEKSPEPSARDKAIAEDIKRHREDHGTDPYGGIW